MALWAAVLLHYWRAVGERQRRSWYALGVAAALLLLTSNAALILLGALVLFTAVTERGRAALNANEPWIVMITLAVFLFVHLLWLQGTGDNLSPTPVSYTHLDVYKRQPTLRCRVADRAAAWSSWRP